MKKTITIFFLLALTGLSNTFAQNPSSENAIAFDGVNDYVTMGNQSTTEFSGWLPYTVEAWIKPTDPNADMSIAGMFNGSISASWQLWLNPNGVLASYRNVGPWRLLSPTNSVVYNAWNRVTTTYDGTSTLSIYVNGNLVASSNAFTSSQPGTSASLMFGASLSNSSPTLFFKGDIDQVDIWNRILSPAEINQYMTCPPLGTESGLVGNWDFNEGTGLTAQDNTIYVHHGTLTNGAVWTTDVPAICVTNIITDLSSKRLLNIYPNPFTSQAIIIFSEEQTKTTIKIMDVLGNEIKQINFIGKELIIDKGEMEKGIYFVQITDEQKRIYNKKIIVQ